MDEVAFLEGATAVKAPDVPEVEGFEGAWESYTLGNADITIKPVYTYSGVLNLQPHDNDGDGKVDYYSVEAKNGGSYSETTISIPGYFNGVPVKIINPISSQWFDSNIREIRIENGVETLSENALAGTDKLNDLYIPLSVTTIEKEAFSNYALGDFAEIKELTIHYEGTKAQWDAIDKKSGWDDGLSTGWWGATAARIECTDYIGTRKRDGTWNWTAK